MPLEAKKKRHLNHFATSEPPASTTKAYHSPSLYIQIPYLFNVFMQFICRLPNKSWVAYNKRNRNTKEQLEQIKQIKKIK